MDEFGFKVINELKSGNYFGEIAVVTNQRRTASVYTISECYIATIS